MLPPQLEEIGDYAFAYCPQLVDIELPAALRVIGFGAFRGCNGIFHIVVPEGVGIVRHRAFADMKNLITLSLPKSLYRTHPHLVDGCPRLRQFTIDPENPRFRIEDHEIKQKEKP